MRRKPLPQKNEADEPDPGQPEHNQAAQSEAETRRFEFEVFKGGKPYKTIPFITVESKKRISVSAGAAHLFGTPKAIELYFDKKNNYVGLRPASTEAQYAMKVMRRGGGQGVRESGFTVSAIAFCNEYGIGTEVSTRYPVEIYDGMLISDLNNPL